MHKLGGRGAAPLRLERAEGEPATGRFDFDAAIWGLVSEAECRAHRDEVERKGGLAWLLIDRPRAPGTSEQERSRGIERECRQAVLEQKWRDRKIIAFGFPRHARKGRRELISPALLEDHLRFNGRGAATWEFEESDGRHGRAYSEVLFYPAPEAEPPTPTADAAAKLLTEPAAPRDTVALRGKAKDWLASYIAERRHRRRDSTLEAMRAAHLGLGVRGSLAVWREFAKANPSLKLSDKGRKSKRSTNN